MIRLITARRLAALEDAARRLAALELDMTGTEEALRRSRVEVDRLQRQLQQQQPEEETR